MQQILDKAVATDRFSISEPYIHAFESDKFEAYSEIKKKLQLIFGKESKKILNAIIRFAFFIEPVKQPKIDSTKFDVRWGDRLKDDPRYSTYDQCIEIFEFLLSELREIIQNDEKKELIMLMANNSLQSYELNIDYKERKIGSPIHSLGNIYFFWDNLELTKQIILLRKFLHNTLNSDYAKFFRAVYDNKIKVKCYLTDRVLTGVHKTNREKRWECHPESVHFALRRECMYIENKLITQICHFADFPEDLKKILNDNKVINLNDEITRCPITLEPLSFSLLHKEVLDPIHGKSNFQVGHLHPLKSILGSNNTGHTSANISWISSEGNRIQGELSMEETRALLLKVFKNYKAVGLVE